MPAALWRLRLLALLHEGGLWLVVFGSLLAVGCVHPWAYVPLWWAAGGLALVTGWRALEVQRARARHGAVRLHVSGGRVGQEAPPRGQRSWTVDLRRLEEVPPLLGPGLAFVAWVLVQLVPIRGVPITLSPPDTVRGLLFVLTALVVHVSAHVLFRSGRAERRFRGAARAFGAVMAAVALAGAAWGWKGIYGVLPTQEAGTSFFGPLVNRDHFAAYLVLLLPLALGRAADRASRFGREAGRGRGWRGRILALETPELVPLALSGLAVLLMLGALLRSLSRGAVVGLAVGLSLLGLRGLRTARGRRLFAIAVTLALAAGAIGVEAVLEKFSHAARDAPGRLVVWQDNLARMGPYWATGSGFDTYALAMSRTVPWRLPVAAEPWPAPVAAAVAAGARTAIYVPAAAQGWTWYREAHNDYLQLLVETGVPGLAIGLLAVGQVLWRTRDDGWVWAGLTGVLVHSLVDFHLQVPGVALMVVTLAAVHARRHARGGGAPLPH